VSCQRRHAFARRLPFLEDLAKLAASAIFTSRLLGRLKSKVHQLGRLLEEAQAAQKGPDLDRTIFTVLTALTYKGGLEFNRALLFVVEGNALVCKLALGPLDRAEAKRIHEDPMWAPGRAPPSLQVLGDLFEMNPQQYLGAPIMSVARDLVVRVGDPAQALCGVRETKKTLVAQAANLASEDKLRALDGGEFAITPLVIDDQAIGAIYVDNRFTRKTITKENIDLLELFASQAAVAIHNAGERERLSRTYRDAYDRVAADTAHSLGNALNPIAARLENMRMTFTAGEAIQLQDLERLEVLYKQAVSIVAQVMKCTTQIVLHPDNVDLGGWIRALVDDRTSGARPRLNCGDQEWLVFGDPGLLGELFRELFQNADNVGATLQDVSLRSPSTQRHRAEVEVVVRDKGPGVPARLKEKIFEPLVSRRPGGTGLGLYRVRRIAEAHGGRVWEGGVENEGAEFHVVLPLKLP
jgi:signal transduction histidine kinase